MTNSTKPIRRMDHNDYVLLKNRIVATSGDTQKRLIEHMRYLQTKFDLRVY